jgi:PAS domain-containing protein
MAQEPVELILIKHWASYMATPMWIMDGSGDLLFYNEPAEIILGRHFDEVGEINADDLADLFVTTELDGSPVENKALPIVVALTERVPAHRQIRLKGFDRVWREIEITALPIEGQGGRHLGAVALFWELSD